MPNLENLRSRCDVRRTKRRMFLFQPPYDVTTKTGYDVVQLVVPACS
jgi:hypothetical protein